MASFRYLVNDIDEAIEFYGKLGFEIRKRYGPVFAIMTRDDIELWVSGPETFAAKSPVTLRIVASCPSFDFRPESNMNAVKAAASNIIKMVNLPT